MEFIAYLPLCASPIIFIFPYFEPCALPRAPLPVPRSSQFVLPLRGEPITLDPFS